MPRATEPSAAVPLTLAPIFGDHAVLQAGTAVPIWGTARDGERVLVRFHGQEAMAVAVAGRWQVTIPALSPTGVGQALEVAGEHGTVIAHDVVVGEVWLCSGQSNMERQLGPREGQQPLEDYVNEAAAADWPQLRFFTVDRVISPTAVSVAGGRWRLVTPSSVLDCSAVAYYFGRALHRARGGALGLIHASMGGTAAQAWTSPEALAAVPALAPLLAAQAEEVAAYLRAPPTSPPAADPRRSWKTVCGLYHGMIQPLLPVALRGVLWYQGESNVADPRQYATLLEVMIADWRSRWGRPDLPFLMVQVAPHRELTPELRAAQEAVALAVPAVGLVCTLDVGDAEDIHPTRKRPVGERLALLARRQVYGEAVTASGPRCTGVRPAGAALVVSFSGAEGGLVATGGRPVGFAIAGADRRFVTALAELHGSTVTLTAPGVEAPLAARYGWANAPVATLANQAGLPAFPFRSDDWPA